MIPNLQKFTEFIRECFGKVIVHKLIINFESFNDGHKETKTNYEISKRCSSYCEFFLHIFTQLFKTQFNTIRCIYSSQLFIFFQIVTIILMFNVKETSAQLQPRAPNFQYFER